MTITREEEERLINSPVITKTVKCSKCGVDYTVYGTAGGFSDFYTITTKQTCKGDYYFNAYMSSEWTAKELIDDYIKGTREMCSDCIEKKYQNLLKKGAESRLSLSDVDLLQSCREINLDSNDPQRRHHWSVKC